MPLYTRIKKTTYQPIYAATIQPFNKPTFPFKTATYVTMQALPLIDILRAIEISLR